MPSETRPLVYHLCGLDAHPVTGRPVPDYLALSEDDHLEMLVNLSQDRGHDGTDRLPGVVRGALWGALVLLGFRLHSWAFRGLYYGLIRDSGQQGEGRGLCTIQLDPEDAFVASLIWAPRIERLYRRHVSDDELTKHALALLTTYATFFEKDG